MSTNSAAEVELMDESSRLAPLARADFVFQFKKGFRREETHTCDPNSGNWRRFTGTGGRFPGEYSDGEHGFRRPSSSVRLEAVSSQAGVPPLLSFPSRILLQGGIFFRAAVLFFSCTSCSLGLIDFGVCSLCYGKYYWVHCICLSKCLDYYRVMFWWFSDLQEFDQAFSAFDKVQREMLYQGFLKVRFSLMWYGLFGFVHVNFLALMDRILMSFLFCLHQWAVRYLSPCAYRGMLLTCYSFLLTLLRFLCIYGCFFFF